MRFLSFLIMVIIISAGLCLGIAYAQQDRFILLYNFNEGKGDTAKDITANGNNGKITDAKWVAGGKFGGGLEFNGKSSLIEIPDSKSLAFTGDKMTIMAWFMPTVLAAANVHPPIVRKGVALPVPLSSWGLDTPGGKLRGFVYMAETGKPIIAEGKASMTSGAWNHAAMVYDGKEIRVYLNGTLDVSIAATGNINATNTPIWVGKKGAEEIYLSGILDELAILSTALTEAQIKVYMASEIKLPGTTAVGSMNKLAISWGYIKGL